MPIDEKDNPFFVFGFAEAKVEEKYKHIPVIKFLYKNNNCIVVRGLKLRKYHMIQQNYERPCVAIVPKEHMTNELREHIQMYLSRYGVIVEV